MFTDVSRRVASLGWRRPYGEGVGLCVEDVLLQTELLHVVREQQIQVLQRLTEEKALHLVPGPRVSRVTDVVNGRVTTTGDLRGADSWLN